MTVTLSRKNDIQPAGKLQTPPVITVPSSKSLSHRALIAAALACGSSQIRNLARNKDTEATIRCLRQLGAWIDDSGDPVLVHGIGTPGGTDRIGADFGAYDGKPVDCGESGSTLRFLLPLFAQSGKRCIFIGKGRLMERPQSVYESIYGRSGEFIRVCGNELTECFSEREKASLPGYITVKGALGPGTYTLRGDVSSQFITGLMFLLPLLDGTSRIEILPPFESASYVDLTMEALRLAGIRTEMQTSAGRTQEIPAAVITIPGRQHFEPFDYTVEGDWSAAAFPIALGALTDGRITVKGVDPDSAQGDRVILDLVRHFGDPGTLHAINADLSDCPDLGPVLFALATQAEGTSIFRGISRLRIKESDRVGCMEKELKKLGCDMRSDADTAWVTGRTEIRGGVTLDGCNDHRIVMALSVLAACAQQPITIEGAEAVSKSWPDFFTQLTKCGIHVLKD